MNLMTIAVILSIILVSSQVDRLTEVRGYTLDRFPNLTAGRLRYKVFCIKQSAYFISGGVLYWFLWAAAKARTHLSPTQNLLSFIVLCAAFAVSIYFDREAKATS